MKLLVASRNRHKLDELGRLLAPHELVSAPAEVRLPPETGRTFAENAVQKARAVAEATGLPSIGDDSGLEAAALGGAPGIRSARFAGEHATDEENVAKLLAAIGPDGDRRARFVCVLALTVPGEEPRCFEGHCDGTLAARPRGSGGFGYDPVFVPVEDGNGRTMAELSAEEKDAISHRGRAARALLEWLGPRVEDAA